MQTAKLFQNGKSQAVRLPKEFRFEGDQVAIRKVGQAVILQPQKNPWETLFESLVISSVQISWTKGISLRYRKESLFDEASARPQHLHLHQKQAIRSTRTLFAV